MVKISLLLGEICHFSCTFGIIIVPLQPKNRDCLYSPARYAREKLRILTAHKTLRFTILGFVVGAIGEPKKIKY